MFWNTKRILILLLCIFEFVIFSLFTIITLIGSIVVFFYLPFFIIIYVIIWNYLLFDILWFITFEYNLKKRIKWILISLYNTYFIILTIISLGLLFFSKDYSIQLNEKIIFIIVFLISSNLCVIINIYAIKKIIKNFKLYFFRISSYKKEKIKL